MFCLFRGLFLWPFAALAGLLGYEAGQSNHNCSASNGTPLDALDIVKARYARGDITKQEFDRIKKDLA